MEEYNIEKAFVGDFIGIRGTVKIENGEHIVIGKNHWVAQGLEIIGNFLINTSGLSGACFNWGIYIGSDTSHPTTVSTTALSSPIGASPGTAPNTLNSSGIYYSASTIPVVITYVATWNAGTVSGTLGEAGLYLYMSTNYIQNKVGNNTMLFASRLSAADGSFTAFTINTTVALTVTWTVSLVYA